MSLLSSKNFFFIFLFSLHSFRLLAYDHTMALKGGLSTTWAELRTKGVEENEEDSFFGMGFNTHLIYRWKRWEAGLSSYIYWGDIDGLKFRTQGQTIEGDATFRHVSFGSVLRYTFLANQVYLNWHMYVGLGPSWSLQTIKLDSPQTNGTFTSNQKLTYESRGGFIMIGLEENLPFKEMHPVYVEFLYSFKQSRKVSIVDSSDATEVDIITTERNRLNSGHFIMVSMGITIF
jgi:hypothetical protein